MAIGNLFGLARNASEYIRRRMSRSVQAADEVASARTSDAERSSLARRLSQIVFGRRDRQQPTTPVFMPPGGQQRDTSQPPIWPGSSDQDQRTGLPPVQLPPQRPPVGRPNETIPPAAGPPIQPLPPGSPPPPPPRPPVGIPDDDDEGDYIRLLGRDRSYWGEDWADVMASMRLTPGSTNVYGYFFHFESKDHGILYVTFLAVGVGGKRSGPGQTYAYYAVPGRKYHQFARASDASAGGAVWDYLRIRGTIAGHQHNYRLVQSHGDYVPRKATPQGFRTRNVTALGQTGRRSYRRSTLPERLFARPNRGTPDRGTPDRGDP